MVQVRIRKADSDAAVLGEIPFTQEALDSVIPLLGRWGVVDADGTELDTKHFIGQFVITPTEAYFEVISAPEDGDL